MTYIVRSDELYHHGIQGQKWGVRRYQNEDGTLTEAGRKRLAKAEYKADKRTLRELKRNVAAENRNLKYRSKLNVENEEWRKKAENAYSEALSKPYYFNIKKGIKKTEDARKKFEFFDKKSNALHQEVLRAERTNKTASDRYINFVNKMAEKYGSKKVKEISYKTVYAGEAYAHDLIKTGFTKSYIPIIGRKEVAKRVMPGDIEDRKNNRDKSLSNNW